VHPEFLTKEVFIVNVHQIYCHFGHKYFEGKSIFDFVDHYFTQALVLSETADAPDMSDSLKLPMNDDNPFHVNMNFLSR